MLKKNVPNIPYFCAMHVFEINELEANYIEETVHRKIAIVRRMNNF
jgi:hypothetical protein